MNYNLARIRNRIAVDKLDDEEYDPSVIDNFINDTQRDIFSEYELSFMEKIYSGTIPTGVTMFNLPNDVSVVQSQVVTNPGGKQMDIGDNYMPFREFNKRYPTPANNAAGPVRYWTSYAGKMILSQPTDGEYTMDIFYIKKPVYLSGDNDQPDIPEEFEELLVLGGFARVQDREGDTDLSLVTEQKYNRKLQQLVNRYGFRLANGVIKLRNRQVGR